MDSRTIPEYDDLDNYNVDDIDDPFRSPPPEAKNSSTNKRKKAEALGLDEEVEVVKRARVPRVKLDEARWVTHGFCFNMTQQLTIDIGCCQRMESPSFGNAPRSLSLRARGMR